MRYWCVILFLAAACVGCQSNASRAPASQNSRFGRFDVIQPIADADPSNRHPVSVRVPLTMQVMRRGELLTISFPTLEKTNLMVGYKMVTGIIHEETIHRDGVAQPLGMSLQDGLVFESSANPVTLGWDGVPKAGQEFALEHRVTLFETDIPAQHMWEPQNGQYYRVLWTRTFKETVR